VEVRKRNGIEKKPVDVDKPADCLKGLYYQKNRLRNLRKSDANHLKTARGGLLKLRKKEGDSKSSKDCLFKEEHTEGLT